MDNSSFPRNRQTDHLGVNKMGKNIKKSPIHQTNFTNPKQQQQPQVYNINKNDFRNIVQRLTGSPSREPPSMGPPVPAHNPPKPPSIRLQKIRPPPLSPLARPPIPPAVPAPFNYANATMNPSPNASFYRPAQPSFSSVPSSDPTWNQTAESPISAYMRYLQNSILDSGTKQSPAVPPTQGVPSSGILPTPVPPSFPSPRGTGPSLLPSPTSQFLLPSPTAFFNLLSPRSPYPLQSPGFQYPPLSPNFSFSPLPQTSGILGPGPQPPPSPGLLFPPSPSGFLPILSPRWRD